MNFFGFLRRSRRTPTSRLPVFRALPGGATEAPPQDPSNPDVTRSPSAPTPHEVRRLLFDAVASGDESRLHALCKEHEDLIVQQSAAWLEVPPEFRTSPELHEWYRNGLRAISQYCAERAARDKLSDGLAPVLERFPAHTD